MAVILPVHILLSLIFLQALRTSSLPEEAFLGYPLQAEADYLYMDSRADPSFPSSSGIKQSETHRRSILDKNFARFGRSGYTPIKNKLLSINADPEIKYMNDDLETDSFGRNARSGEKSDQFIRFGRGKSDFVRFGRSDPYTRNRDFIRFGRSTRSVKPIKNKQEVAHHVNRNHLKIASNANNVKHEDNNQDGGKEKGRKKRSASLDFYKKAGSNFVRFGRGDRNDNFMRFGRLTNENNYLNGQQGNSNNQNKLLAGEEGKGSNVGNNMNLKKYLEELQGQQSHDLLMKMLVDVLTRSRLQQELQQLQLIEQHQNGGNKEHGKDDTTNDCT